MPATRQMTKEEMTAWAKEAIFAVNGKSATEYYRGQPLRTINIIQSSGIDLIAAFDLLRVGQCWKLAYLYMEQASFYHPDCDYPLDPLLTAEQQTWFVEPIFYANLHLMQDLVRLELIEVGISYKEFNSSLKKLSKLKYLCLANCYVHDEDLTELFKGLVMPSMLELSLVECPFSGPGLAQIPVAFPNLKMLDLSEIEFESMEPILDVVRRMPNLKFLILSPKKIRHLTDGEWVSEEAYVHKNFSIDQLRDALPSHVQLSDTHHVTYE